MSQQYVMRSKPRLTGSGIFLGGLVGGLVGFLVRGGITFYNLRGGAELGFLASLPSGGIGFLCGAIAGAFCRPWLGALLGTVLSAGVFGLFLLPFSYFFSLFLAASTVVDFTSFFLQKAIAGAIAGGVGGYVGSLIVASENNTRQPWEEPPNSVSVE
jgi:hypothetical protein